MSSMLMTTCTESVSGAAFASHTSASATDGFVAASGLLLVPSVSRSASELAGERSWPVTSGHVATISYAADDQPNAFATPKRPQLAMAAKAIAFPAAATKDAKRGAPPRGNPH